MHNELMSGCNISSTMFAHEDQVMAGEWYPCIDEILSIYREYKVEWGNDFE